MAGASITKSVVCANCGRPVDKTKIQARNAGLFCDACAAGMRGGHATEEERNCPACGVVVPLGTSLCKSCGFDYELGYSPKAVEKQTTVKRYKPPCVHCGYDRSGMNDDEPCPECSKKNRVKKTVKEKEAMERAREQLRPMQREIGFVLLWVAASAGVIHFVLWDTGELARWGSCGVSIALRYAALLVIVLTSLFMFVESEVSTGRIVWRLVGAAFAMYASEELLLSFSTLIAVQLGIAYPLATAWLVCLLHRSLELEWLDAGILGVGQWVLVIAFGAGLRAMIGG